MALWNRFGWMGFAAALLALYAASIPVETSEIPEGVLTISQAHRVKGEEFLLSASGGADALLVGSSLSAVLPRIALQPVENLSFSGGSAATGLRLVTQSARLPHVIFIEANVLERAPDEELLRELFNPVLRQIKAWCIACRTRNQPVTLAVAQLSRWRLPAKTQEVLDRDRMQAPLDDHPNPLTFAVQLAASKQAVDTDTLERSLDGIESSVRTLRRAGTRVVFVDMPMDPAIGAGARNRSIVEAVRRRFPAGSNEWISFPAAPYRTVDGIHLAYREARSVAATISQVAGIGARF